MSNSETIGEFLARVLKEGFVELRRDSSVSLAEMGPDVDMKVVIDNIAYPFAILRPDKIGHLKRLKETKGFRRACDYLLILELPGTHRAILIELKKTVRDDEGPEQLQRSIAIYAYLETLYYAETGQTREASPVDCAIVYETLRLDKKGVRPRRSGRELLYKNIKIRTLRVPGPYPIASLLEDIPSRE